MNAIARRLFLVIACIGAALSVAPATSAQEEPTDGELYGLLVEWAEENDMRGLSPASMTPVG